MDEEDSADTMRKKRAVSRLRDIKDLEKDKDGKAYSYSTLAEAINEHTKTWLEGDFRDDADLSKHHISSYLGSRKSKKGKKSSLPKGLRLEVIERFILDCTEIGKLYNNKLVTSSNEIPLSANALFAYLMKGNSASKTNACQLLGTFEYINAINRYQIEFNGTDNIKYYL